MIPVLFFVSGFCALTYEIVWQRLFVQLVGSTTLATTVVLCLFMAGMALGALDFYLIRDRLKNKLMLFACLETVIGIFGLLSSFLNSRLESIYFSFIKTLAPSAGVEIQSMTIWIFVFLVLLVPTMCMGATLPVLAGWARQNSGNPQSTVNWLYAINTLGAFAGTIFGGIVLTGHLGMNATLMVAFALNMIVAAMAAVLANSTDSSVIPEKTEPASSIESSPLTEAAFVLSVFVSGLAALALEVVWTKYLVVFFGSSTYSLACVIAICLLGIATGTFIVTLCAGKLKTNLSTLALLLTAAAATLAICLHQYNWTPYIYLALVKSAGTELSARMIAMILTTGWLIFVPAATCATIFPFAINCTKSKSGKEIEGSVAKLWIANIAGTVCGAVLAFVLFDRDLTHLFTSTIQILTIWLVSLMVVSGLLVFLARLQQEKENKRTLSVFLSLVLLTTALLVARPEWKPALLTIGYSFIPNEILKQHSAEEIIDSQASRAKIEFYREAANSIVCVKRDRTNNVTYLSTNGKTEAAIPITRSAPCPMSDLKTHTLMGLAATLLCPNENQESIVIGYGSGTTCGTVLQADWVKSLDAVEIDESIFSIDPFFQPANLSPLNIDNIKSGKLKPIVADARNYLNLTDRKFDTIVSQPAEPWSTGSSNLYTREFFSLARSKLKKNGIMCQWIQLYSIDKNGLASLIKTFHEVFEKQSLILHSKNAGEIILLGFNEPPEVSLKKIDKRISSPNISNVLASIDLHSAAQLFAEIVCFPGEIDKLVSDSDITINTDDNLYSELSLGKNPVASDSGINDLIEWLCFKNRFPEPSEVDSVTGILKLDMEHKIDNVRFLSQMAFRTLDKNHSAFRPYSDRELVNRYGLVGVKEAYRICPLSILRIKKLLNDIRTTNDGLYGRLTSARIYQMLKSNKLESALFKESYSNLKSQDNSLLLQKDPFIEANLAKFFLIEDETDKAVKHALSVSVEGNNTNHYALDLAGRVLLFTDQLKPSIQRFKKALELKNNSNQTLSSMALALKLSDADNKQVIELLESSLAINPNQYIPRYLLGKILFEDGKLSLCLTEMLKASKVSFTDASPNVFVTAAFQKIHHWKNARQNLTNLKKKQPDSIFLLPLDYSITAGEKNDKAKRILKNKIVSSFGFEASESKIKTLNNLILESSTPKEMYDNFREKLEQYSSQN